MDDAHDPATDAALLNLKRAALTGRGEHGRAFDGGVLAVIEQVERLGEFLPDPVRVVYAVHKVRDRDLPDVLRPEDVEAARRLVAERGSTMEEGAAYARGVITVEKDLAHFRAAGSGVGPPVGTGQSRAPLDAPPDCSWSSWSAPAPRGAPVPTPRFEYDGRTDEPRPALRNSTPLLLAIGLAGALLLALLIAGALVALFRTHRTADPATGQADHAAPVALWDRTVAG